MSLHEQLKDAMKQAMRAKDKDRLGVIRMALAAIKQVEIDDNITLDDAGITAVLTKMVKQRKDSANVYVEGGRQELADKELAEIVVLQDFLPQPLSDSEVDELIKKAIDDTQASSMAEMGKVMAQLKPVITGRADLGQVSGKIRAILNA